MKKWTVVQHSGFGYGGNPQFRQGLETRTVRTVTEQKKVLRACGILFDSYMDAETFAEAAMYPPEAQGLIPEARGTFATLNVDGLAVYKPTVSDYGMRATTAANDAWPA